MKIRLVSFHLFLCVMLLLVGCKKKQLHSNNVNQIIAVVIDAGTSPLPPPPPPKSDGTDMDKATKVADSIYGLSREIKLVNMFFKLEFSKLPKDIPDEFLVLEKEKQYHQRTINVENIDELSKHKIESTNSEIINTVKDSIGRYTWTVRFSNIHFNHDETVAALILESQTGNSGLSVFYGLKKLNGEWKITYIKELSFS